MSIEVNRSVDGGEFGPRVISKIIEIIDHAKKSDESELRGLLREACFSAPLIHKEAMEEVSRKKDPCILSSLGLIFNKYPDEILWANSSPHFIAKCMREIDHLKQHIIFSHPESMTPITLFYIFMDFIRRVIQKYDLISRFPTSIGDSSTDVKFRMGDIGTYTPLIYNTKATDAFNYNDMGLMDVEMEGEEYFDFLWKRHIKSSLISAGFLFDVVSSNEEVYRNCWK